MKFSVKLILFVSTIFGLSEIKAENFIPQGSFLQRTEFAEPSVFPAYRGGKVEEKGT